MTLCKPKGGWRRAASRTSGVTLEEPFLDLAFLALPAIPYL